MMTPARLKQSQHGKKIKGGAHGCNTEKGPGESQRDGHKDDDGFSEGVELPDQQRKDAKDTEGEPVHEFSQGLCLNLKFPRPPPSDTRPSAAIPL